MTATATTDWFEALGYRFRIESEAPLVAHVDEAFSSLAAADGATGGTEYRLLPSVEHSRQWELEADGERLLRSHDRGYLYSYLWWHVNRGVIDPNTSHVLLHASCAADDDGRAVILPADQNHGKTTTVAALVADGLAYLTDEATALRPDGSGIDPYAKPLSVDRGSWDVLAHLAPDVSDDLSDVLHSQWQLPASQIGRVASQATPALIVSPAWTEDVDGVDVEELTPPDALMVLGENCFNLKAFGVDGFRLLEDVARSVPAYRIRYGDLDVMVQTVRSLLDGAR